MHITDRPKTLARLAGRVVVGRGGGWGRRHRVVASFW